jgi:protein Mpv17
LVGYLVFAPLMHVWFGLIGRIQHPNKIIQTILRVGADQGLGGPWFPALFFTSMTLMEGGTLLDVRKKLELAWFDTWKVGVVVFTPASAINQSIIPPPSRVLFMNGVALGWNTYLAYTNSKQGRTLTLQRDAALSVS